MDAVTAGIVAVVVGIGLIIIAISLIRHWNRENRKKWPERVPDKFTLFKIDRTPRSR